MVVYTDVRAEADGSWPDEFNRNRFAIGLAKVLSQQPSQSLPLVAGIFAPWGGGKTHFAKQVEHAIREAEPKSKILWFEPWRYQSRQDIAAAILFRLIKAIEDDRSSGQIATDRMARISKRIGKVFASSIGRTVERATTLPINETVNAIFDGWSAPDPEYQAETDDLITELGALVLDWTGEHRAFMFIDDLDRCLPEQMIRLMEALHVFLAEAPMTFIVAVDRSALDAAIAQRYGNQLSDVGRLYVDKIVHLPFSLPPLSPDGAHAKYGARLKEMGIVESREILLQKVLGDNPRYIERFVNQFDLARQLALASGVLGAEIDQDALVLISVLRIKFPAFCEAWDRCTADGVIRFARFMRGSSREWEAALIAEDFAAFVPFGVEGHPVRSFFRSLDDVWWKRLVEYPRFEALRSFAG